MNCILNFLGLFWITHSVQSTVQVRDTFWKLFYAPTKSVPRIWSNSSLLQSTTEHIFFKGFKVHPTESYPYPTTPSPDTGFANWEEEQEMRYTQAILANISSPMDSKLELRAKALVAKFFVNAVKDNRAGKLDDSDYPWGEYEYEKPKESPLLPSEALNNYVWQNPQDPGTNFSIPAPTAASSPLNTFINRLISGPPRVMVDPTATTEYYIVPAHPLTERNTISAQKEGLSSQIQRLVSSLNNRNISGVVDESLRIASLQTVGVFVTGFLNLLLCNPVDRWNGECST